MTGAHAQLFAALVTGPLRHAAGRTVLAVVVIALGVALGLGVTLVNRSAASEVSLAARSLFGLSDLVVQGTGAGFDEALFPVLARLPAVALANPVVDVPVRVVGQQTAVTALGIDFFRAARMQPSIGVEAPRTNLSPLAADAVFLSPAAARDLNLKEGDTLTVQVGLAPVSFQVAGILPAAAYRQRAMVLDIGTAQWRLGQLGKLQRVELRLRSGAATEEVQQQIAALLPPGVTVTTPGAETDEALRLTRAYRSNLTALALVALFTGAFLVHSTQSLAVIRRRREFALLKAMGLSAREQIASTLAGGAIVGSLGALCGVGLGIVIAAAGLNAFGADLGAGYFRGIAPALKVEWLDVAVFFLLGTAAAIAGTLRPAVAAARVPAALALKAGDIEDPAVRGNSIAGVALWVLAGGLLLLPAIDGLPLAGYSAIALVLVGAVFLMPAVTRLVLRLLPETRSVPWQIATAHLRGTARQATTSLSAILVSFSLMVAMAVMVTSFRTSLDQWLEKILPADLYLRAGFTSETAFLEPNDVSALVALPEVERVDANRFAQLAVAGLNTPLALIARPIREQDAGRTLWLEAAATTAVPGDAQPVWISEAAADLLSVRSGDGFTGSIGERAVRFSVRGVYRDYERQNGGVVIDHDAYVRLTGDVRANAAWLWLKSGADVDALVDSIHERLPGLAEFDVRRPGEIRAITLRIFDRTFAVTYLLEVIAVCIGLAGIAASTSAQVIARRAELGVLRHVGLLRRQVGFMLAAEGGLLGAVGVLAGLVIGSVVSLILIYVVNRQSFHWSMDVYFPWTLLTLLSLSLVAAAALTAVWSGRLALRDDVVRAVKEDW
jgi:putative ABC transport system permease protein